MSSIITLDQLTPDFRHPDFKYPLFKTEPYEHQLLAFNRFKDKPYFGLFADMGTGKTKVSIDIAAYRWQKGMTPAMVVIAPNHVHEQWVQDEIPKHCPVPYRVLAWNSNAINRGWFRRQVEEFTGLSGNFMKVYAFNVEAFQFDSVIPYIAEFVRSQDCFIVVDEATRIKSPEAKRSKTIRKLEKYGMRAILTGTPTAKSPFDLWSMMEFLKSNYFGVGYFVFQHRYGILMKCVNESTGAKYTTNIDEPTYASITKKIQELMEARNGNLMPDDYAEVADIVGVSERDIRFIEHHPEFTKYKRLDELRNIIKDDVFSIKKADCLDLPEKVYEKIYVDLSKDQKAVYKSLVKDLYAEYEGKEVTVTIKLALTTRLAQVVGGFFPYMEQERHIAGSQEYFVPKAAGLPIGTTNPKVDALIAQLDEIDPDEQVIVWARFVPELKMLRKAIEKTGRSVGLFYGEVDNRDRQIILNNFKSGKTNVFLGNTATAGFGLNLQNASIQLYYSNDFRTEARLQAEDRTHRIGQKNTCLYKDFIARGTIEEKIMSVILEGKDLNDFFMSTSLKEMLSMEDVF